MNGRRKCTYASVFGSATVLRTKLRVYAKKWPFETIVRRPVTRRRFSIALRIIPGDRNPSNVRFRSPRIKYKLRKNARTLRTILTSTHARRCSLDRARRTDGTFVRVPPFNARARCKTGAIIRPSVCTTTTTITTLSGKTRRADTITRGCFAS